MKDADLFSVLFLQFLVYFLYVQVLDLMDFIPKMDCTPKLMDRRIFCDEPMGLNK